MIAKAPIDNILAKMSSGRKLDSLEPLSMLTPELLSRMLDRDSI